MNPTRLLCTCLLGAIAALLAACASMSASSTEPLLSAAGFRVHTPKGAEQEQLYASLPAYKVQRGTHKGKIFYAYKDEKQGIAYIGDEQAYQKYQALAVQRNIASSYYHAAVMNEMTASRWYGAYYAPVWYR